MQRLQDLVRLGNFGISVRYLACWWDGAIEPRPPDLEEGSVRVAMGIGSGFAWDLKGADADAFRSLVANAARSINTIGTDRPPSSEEDLGTLGQDVESTESRAYDPEMGTFLGPTSIRKEE